MSKPTRDSSALLKGALALSANAPMVAKKIREIANATCEDALQTTVDPDETDVFYELPSWDPTKATSDELWEMSQRTRHLNGEGANYFKNLALELDKKTAKDRDHRDLGAQGDLFVLDLLDASFQSDKDSMAVPYFALNAKDLKRYEWVSGDGNLEIKILPPNDAQNPSTSARVENERAGMPSRYKKQTDLVARASIHDKDILIYLASCLFAQLRAGERLPDNNKVAMTPYSFFKATDKSCGKEAYVRLREALERLSRTHVLRRERDKKTGKWSKEKGFSIVSAWESVIDQTDDRNSVIEITLAEEFANAIKAKSVLRLHADYFKLRKGLAKAVYLTARARCRNQPDWKISLEKLRTTVGSTEPLRNFKISLTELIDGGGIPEYDLQLTTNDDVVFYNVTGQIKLPPLKLKTIRQPRKKAVDK